MDNLGFGSGLVPQLIAGAGGNANTGRLPLADPVSRTKHMPYWDRDDCYWDDWRWAQPPLFAPRYRIDRDVDPDTGAVELSRTLDVDDAGSNPRTWKFVSRSPVLRRVVAVLDGFHHATTKQLVAATGMHPSDTYRYLVPGWDTGLLSRGRFQPADIIAGKLTRLWALWHGKPLNRWTRQLPDGERTLLYGTGSRPHPSGPHARHDVLCLEAVLRLLETGHDWIGLTGEPHATGAQLCPWLPDAPARLAGDAVLWRSDGLRVVLEVCASRDMRHIARKMALWASWLGQHGRDRTGLVVVFLNAHRGRHGPFATSLRHAHEQIIAPGRFTIADRVPAPWGAVERAADSIHLASWEDWFPRHHRVSEAGAAMTTIHRVRQASRADGAFRWSPSGLAAPETDDRRFAPLRAMPPPPQWSGTPPWNHDLPLVVPDVAL